MQLCSIASGSSGNCIFVASDHCRLLIDAGLSGKRIEEGLNEIGWKTPEMDAILVTHEHADHIKGLGVIARRYGLPMYATGGTIEWIREHHAIGDVDETLFQKIVPEVPFEIRDIRVLPVSISHDAAEPVAFRLQCGKKSAAVLTDLGTWDHRILEHMQGLDVLLLEANHDVRMLEAGRYPYPLKQRILSDRGHLSNEASGHLLEQLLHDNFQKVLLGHLSKENNYPQLAAESVKLEITLGDTPYRGGDFPIEVAGRDAMSELISF